MYRVGSLFPMVITGAIVGHMNIVLALTPDILASTVLRGLGSLLLVRGLRPMKCQISVEYDLQPLRHHRSR